LAPVANGAIYGDTKWLPNSLGCDLFVPQDWEVIAPADCIVKLVLGGTGLQGGAELILALPDNSWAWRWRHVRAESGITVGLRVPQGKLCARVHDDSLNQLGRIPGWATAAAGKPFPSGWQHLDLSVNQGTDQFAPTGGGGGNVDADQWVRSIGYQGTMIPRTPGPPDAGFGMAESVRMMMPQEYHHGLM
jgi:hypothetical protein